jgi:dUTP pyrophosphatase
MTKTLDNGEEKDVSYYLYPRSSLAKTRLRLSNSVGIIDSGYRGEIMAAFDVVPVVRDNAVYEPEEISLHQRLVQICSPTLDPVQLVVVDSPEKLNLKTERGSGGFGSTGK